MPWHRRLQKDRYPCSKSVAVPTQVVKTKSWVSTRDRKKQPRYSWVRTPASLELNSREKNYRYSWVKEGSQPCRVVCHEHTGPEHPAAEGRTPHLGAAAHQSRRGTISAIQQSRYAEVKQYLVPQAGRAPHHSCTSACSRRVLALRTLDPVGEHHARLLYLPARYPHYRS